MIDDRPDGRPTLGGVPLEGSGTAGEMSTLGVMKGVGLTAALHLIQIPFAFTLAFLFIGGTQLVYMLPAFLIAYMKGHRDIATGLVIGAAITLLVNAACFILVLQSFE